MEKRPNIRSIIKTIPEKLERWSLEIMPQKLGFKERPVNIYEVHAGSWKPYTFKQLKEELIPYLVGDELHPRGIYASDGPSIGLELGLSAHGTFCTRADLW